MIKCYCAGLVETDGVHKLDIPRHDFDQARGTAQRHFEENPKSKVVLYSYEYKAVHQLTELFSARLLPVGKVELCLEPPFDFSLIDLEKKK